MVVLTQPKIQTYASVSGDGNYINIDWVAHTACGLLGADWQGEGSYNDDVRSLFNGNALEHETEGIKTLYQGDREYAQAGAAGLLAFAKRYKDHLSGRKLDNPYAVDASDTPL